MNTNDLTRVTELAKSIIGTTLKTGDLVVDATMGNGNDTLFLAKTVGCEGMVMAFDIQNIAIRTTRELLEKNNICHNVRLIQDGHENMDQYISGEISGAMFNLGYLPKGDHDIITKDETTIIAVEKCLKVLKKNGVITILIYYGHPGGEKEKENILSYVQKLNQNKFHVLKIDYINQTNNPPILISIIKK